MQGIRGNHPEDITGMQMRTMAMTLYTDKDIEDILFLHRHIGWTGKTLWHQRKHRNW